MQLQMEVWDFDECDFLETVFKQYETKEEFLADGETFTHTNKNKRKGIIIRFYDGEQLNFYINIHRWIFQKRNLKNGMIKL